MSLKYGLIKYPACISFTVTGKCVPFKTFLCIIFNILSISACLVKTFGLIYLYSLDFGNYHGSWRYDLSGFWYISEITPS